MPWPQRGWTKNRPPRDVTALTLTPTVDDASTTAKSSPTVFMSQSHPSDGQMGSGFHNMGMAAGGSAFDPAFPALPDFLVPAGTAWGEQMYTQTPTNGQPSSGMLQNQPAHPQAIHRTQSLMHTPSSSSVDSTTTATPNGANSNNGDLQSLERLKSEILAGQNPIYRAVPQPKFLESLYLGRASEDAVIAPAHPDQVPDINKAGRSANDSTLEKIHSSATGVVRPGSSSALGDKSDSHVQNHIIKTERGSQEGIRTSDKTLSDASALKHTGSDDREEALKDPTQQASQQSIGSLSGKPTMIIPDSRDSRYSGSQSAGSLGGSFSRDRAYDSRDNSRRSDYNRDIPADDDRVPRRDYRNNRYNDLRHHDHEVKDRVRERSRSRERRVVDNRLDERRIPEYPPPRERRPTISDSRDIRPQDNRRQEPRAISDRMDVDRRSIPATPDHTSDDPRAIPADDRRDYLSRRESMPKDQNALPRTPISMMSSPDKVADRARPPPESQNHRPPAARDRSIDRPREGLGDDRGRTLPYDDRSRKAVVESTSDRPMKPDPATLEERVSRPLENRISDRPHVPLEERIGAPSERSSSRPPPALQERISDRPALEERIGNRPASALDDRNVTSDLGRAAPSLESRLSQHSARDEERGRPANDGRTDERRPATYGSGPVHSSPRPSLSGTHPPSPRHENVRDTRRISPGPTSFRDEREGRFVDGPGRYERPPLPRDRDIAPPPSSDDRARPSMEAREWRERGSFVPSVNDSYNRDERYPPASDPRDWSDRSYRPPPPPQWEGGREAPGVHDVGRPRERYDEREPPRGVWDPSQRDDRRQSGPLPPPSRASWDRADDPMVARTREPFPPTPVERGPPPAERNADRFVTKYPPSEYPPRDGARVRPRSPSPIRRPVDDVRPPVKRAREDGPGYYDDPRRIPVPPASAGYTEYHSRTGSPPPPPPPSSGSYYDSRSVPYSPRDPREVPPPPQAYDRRERAGTERDIGGGYYERRSEMPPPRSPPYQSRTVYSRPDTRDDRRYTAPPPRTA